MSRQERWKYRVCGALAWLALEAVVLAAMKGWLA